jgi:hypothetical protein
MKASLIALALSCLAFSGFAETRVDLTAVVGKDFMDRPSFDQAARALGADAPFGGIGWEVVIGRIGIGGSYIVDFNRDEASNWWLDWEGQAAYCSYHFLGPRSFVDPFADAGIGCAGRVFLGRDASADGRLALTLYPFVSGGAALELDGLRVGAKLSYALSRNAVPVTSIPDYPLGRFQASVFVGFSIGGWRL